MQKTKDRINLAIIGDIDSGKSTLAGHLIYKHGDSETKISLDQKAKEIGRYCFCYAWIFDRLKSEREKGVSIIASHQRFETAKFHFTLIDIPGHREFMKNAITGTSQADAAILVVPATPDIFEEGISKLGQTREHALVAYILGVRFLIVCVNKMDIKEVNWSQTRFETIKRETLKMLEVIGYKSAKVLFIPVSGYFGDNMTERSSNLQWFEGPSLLEAIDTIIPPKRPIEKPLRIPIFDVYKVGGYGTIPVGRVESGVIKRGTIAFFAPHVIASEVKSLEIHNRRVEQGIPGDFIGFHIRGVSVLDIHKGDVCGDSRDNPPKEVSSFVVQIVILNHPGRIKKGYCPVVYCHTARVACRFERIIERIDKRTATILEKEPEELKEGDCAIVKLVPMKPLCVEVYSEYPQLGRFIFRDMKQTVGAGVIKSVEKKERDFRLSKK